MMLTETLANDSVLRVGEVSGIDGRRVYITVDKNKNSSDLLYDGKIIKNVSVGGYIEIAKGFLSIIGKVDGERLEKEVLHQRSKQNALYELIDKNKRTLTISLLGYIGYDGKFKGGIKELPLIGNEAYILTEEKIHKIHSLLKNDSPLYINIAKTDIEEIKVDLPIDGIFNSHIAIFGNTGSGKSNTLAILYQEMYKNLLDQDCDKFKNSCKFLLFDFNGEYVGSDCITTNDHKTVYSLSTQRDNANDKIPINSDDLLDIETFSILVDATEKTQKPFLRRTFALYRYVKQKDAPFEYLKGIFRRKVEDILRMTNKDIAYRLLDYITEALSQYIDSEDELALLRDDLRFHDVNKSFYSQSGQQSNYFNAEPDKIRETNLYRKINELNEVESTLMDELIVFLHIQLITDLYQYKIQNDHVYPVVNRIKAKKNSILRVFDTGAQEDIWKEKNFLVINLHDVNIDMKKTIPLLIAKKLYKKHKDEDNKKTLNIIIDEAHNILSKQSFREAEEWKDYRLETFEEIIKEGRKFGVFLTIASQRPNDISDTIISQAHNYFIHQLINERDLQTISKAVSYIDKITEESIPTLPVGTCIFSGIATPMPLKLKVDELPENKKPASITQKFGSLLGG
jgi:DNA helicase HerA-like ATPase